MQGTGLPGRRLGESYNNTDFTIVDETDMVDIWHVLVYSKQQVPAGLRSRAADRYPRAAADRGRFRHHAGRTKSTCGPSPTPSCCAFSNFDSHGYTVDPYLLIEHPEKKGVLVNIPFRAMLPKGIEGLIVTGLSISSHRDAVPLIRMQPDVQNGGYAAGVAAAMAAEADVPIRKIDVKKLQQHLVDIGNLKESVLTDQDSYPLPDEKIAAAVEVCRRTARGAAVIITHSERALPLLKKAYGKASAEDKVIYAQALAVLGSDAGFDTLLAAVQAPGGVGPGLELQGHGAVRRGAQPAGQPADHARPHPQPQGRPGDPGETANAGR